MPVTTRPWAIFFDLDDTLVLTSSLAPLRTARQWDRIYRSLHVTMLPPGTSLFLQQAAQLASLGVITRSPRPYAQRLLTYHQLPIPVLVAFHDTARRKPFPDPIIKAAALQKVALAQSFYIGDTEDDLLAASRAGAIPIGLSWDGSLMTKPEGRLARALCTQWNDVLAVIEQIMTAEEV